MRKLDYAMIGLRIKEKRKLLGYRRDEMAEYLGVSDKFCADIENGDRGMSLSTLNKISEFLFVSTDYILFGDVKKTDISELVEIFKFCPKNKIRYAEDILRIYIKSINSD